MVGVLSAESLAVYDREGMFARSKKSRGKYSSRSSMEHSVASAYSSLRLIVPLPLPPVLALL